MAAWKDDIILDGITLTDLIKMDAKSLTSGTTMPSSTIKMPNGVEIHVSFEGYGTDKSSEALYYYLQGLGKFP